MKKAIVIILTILLVFISIFFFYVNDYYKANSEVYEILENEYVIQNNNYIQFKNDSKEGLIFYPGGKVEYEAYLTLCNELSKSGLNVFLIEMPFNLAFFDINAADNIIKSNPDIKQWSIGGHSLGGIFASLYAANNKDLVNELILLGSYNNYDYPSDNTLTIYGENDILMKNDINYDTNVYEIKGGNHSYFGSYGLQTGDGIATITNEEQINITVNKVYEFITRSED